MDRHFLDWRQPFLPAAASWLVEAFRREPGRVDMEQAVCVTPGRRAGRILLGQLVELCEVRALRLIPPRMITPGALADALLVCDEATATREECLLAWLGGLRDPAAGARPSDLARLVPHPPAPEDLLAWHGLAATLHGLHEELAGAGLDFAAVGDRADAIDHAQEGDRWRAMHGLYGAYGRRLAAAGLADPHDAQRAALSEGRWRDGTAIVLLGVTDLTRQQRAIIDAVAGDRATALVHAPPDRADAFDGHGCVDPRAWQDACPPVTDEQIVIAGGPSGQAQAALRAIAGLDAAYAAEEITIGLGDRELAASLARAAAAAGLSIHDAAGVALPRTAPFRLLDALAEWQGEKRFAQLAALARHPDLDRWLHPPGANGEGLTDVLAMLDDYHTDRLHDPLVGPLGGEDGRRGAVEAVRARVDELLLPLTGEPRPLRAWCGAVLDVLARVYDEVEIDHAAPGVQATVGAALALRETIVRHARTASALDLDVDAGTAIGMLLTEAAGAAVAADAGAGQIEALGWLELHLDPAPCLVLLGANDGLIPGAVLGDPFLPDTLRRELGVMDNRGRYARDAYLLEALCHVKRHLTVVAGRTTLAGDPLAPSRLLLACDDEAMVRRVGRMTAGPDGTGRPAAPARGGGSRFVVPALPDDLPLPTDMRVTSFGRYLRCGYRYALQELLGLRPSADDAVELDARAFGTLAHRVLQAFGADPLARDEGDPRAIAAFLDAALDRIAAEGYGPGPLPALRVQVARLRQRLRAFAEVQAGLRAEGWRIREVERFFDGAVALDVPGQEAMPLRGIIDRIDENERTGAWRIIDYKTSEGGASPEKTHNGGARAPTDGPRAWQDLQLPLYRFLVRGAGIAERPELAYIVLPGKLENVTVRVADWSDVEIDAAVDVARGVVTDIRAREFPLNREISPRFDEFARVCQSFAFEIDDDDGLDTAGDAP